MAPGSVSHEPRIPPPAPTSAASSSSARLAGVFPPTESPPPPSCAGAEGRGLEDLADGAQAHEPRESEGGGLLPGSGSPSAGTGRDPCSTSVSGDQEAAGASPRHSSHTGAHCQQAPPTGAAPDEPHGTSNRAQDPPVEALISAQGSAPGQHLRGRQAAGSAEPRAPEEPPRIPAPEVLPPPRGAPPGGINAGPAEEEEEEEDWALVQPPLSVLIRGPRGAFFLGTEIRRLPAMEEEAHELAPVPAGAAQAPLWGPGQGPYGPAGGARGVPYAGHCEEAALRGPEAAHGAALLESQAASAAAAAAAAGRVGAGAPGEAGRAAPGSAAPHWPSTGAAGRELSPCFGEEAPRAAQGGAAGQSSILHAAHGDSAVPAGAWEQEALGRWDAPGGMQQCWSPRSELGAEEEYALEPGVFVFAPAEEEDKDGEKEGPLKARTEVTGVHIILPPPRQPPPPTLDDLRGIAPLFDPRQIASFKRKKVTFICLLLFGSFLYALSFIVGVVQLRSGEDYSLTWDMLSQAMLSSSNTWVALANLVLYLSMDLIGLAGALLEYTPVISLYICVEVVITIVSGLECLRPFLLYRVIVIGFAYELRYGALLLMEAERHLRSRLMGFPLPPPNHKTWLAKLRFFPGTAQDMKAHAVFLYHHPFSVVRGWTVRHLVGSRTADTSSV